MIWTRHEKPVLRPKRSQIRIEINQYRRILGVAGAVLLLGVALLLPVQRQIRSLNEEKNYWQALQLKNRTELPNSALPQLLDVPAIITQCQNIFREEQNRVLSVNLERLGEETTDLMGTPGTETPGIKFSYALLRFHLAGNWRNIEAGMKSIENIPDQVIRFQEVHLAQEGGDLVAKVYFYEPDNPSLP